MQMKKILFIDLDNVLVDFPSALPHIPEDTKTRYEDHLDDIPGIFAKMVPMVGAVEAFEKFSKIFDTYVLSTAPWNNPSAWSDKLEWVQNHLGESAYKRLILTHHKNLNRGDFLIDDREKNGAGSFEGELILFGSKKFPDWNTVTEYLIRRV